MWLKSCILIGRGRYFGYQVGIGPGQWNALNCSQNDKALSDLLERQLFKPSGLPDEELVNFHSGRCMHALQN